MAEIGDAISYPFRRFGRLFYWLWMLLPIIGWFFFYGYLIRLIRGLVKGNIKEVPEFGDFGENFKLGFFYFLYTLVISIILMIVLLIPVFGILVYIFALLIFPILIIQFVMENEIGKMFEKGFDIPKATKMVFLNFGVYILLILKLILFGIIAFVASLPIITILITYPAYLYASQYILTDFYRTYSKKVK